MVPHLLPMRSLLSDLRDRLRNERSRWSEISDRHQPKSVIAMDRNGRSGCSEIRNHGRRFPGLWPEDRVRWDDCLGFLAGPPRPADRFRWVGEWVCVC